MGSGSCKEAKNSDPIPSIKVNSVIETQDASGIPKSGATVRTPLPPEEAVKRNLEIEKSLVAAKAKDKTTVKLLLLGGGESGKSTIAKQMKILHSNGFDEIELINVRYLARNNVVKAVDQLLGITHKLDEQFVKHQVSEFGWSGIRMLNYQVHVVDLHSFIMFKSSQELMYADLSNEVAESIERLWSSYAFQVCYGKRHEIELLDSAKYFLDDVERIAAADYAPTAQDALRCRKATTGITEMRFEFRNKTFRLIDVGGQRSERRKWIHCFDDVTAILFVSSIAEYNQQLSEEPVANRMEDSLELFRKITSNPTFAKTPIILFLNKKDIFEEKIKKYPISNYFPAFKGNPRSFNEASEFVKGMYQERNPKGKPFYAHFTNATDTKNVDVVFVSCMDIVLKKNMANAGVF